MTHAWRLSLLLAALTWAAPQRVSAQAPLIGGLGGAAGYGENSLTRNDDGSSSFISLGGSFPAGLRFYGSTYSGLYLNNNGNVSFAGALSTYTPDPFPVASRPMIAPWWADVDTRSTTLLPAERNLVYWDIQPGIFTATWYDVGYYSSHVDRWNAFQLIIRDASAFGIAGAFDVEFRYNRCEWTTGDLSGGVAAQAGFDAGDGTNYLTLPGSRTPAVVNLCMTSNVGETGVWRFQVRPAGIATCGNSIRELGEDCDDGNIRAGDGCSARCTTERPPGSPCTVDPDCASGFCTDGVCCNRRCGSQCEACAEAGSVGTCSTVAGSPRGARVACASSGTACGGACDGVDALACHFPGATTACDDGAFCTTSDRCNGAGACTGGGARVCDDGRACTTDACDEAGDRCTTTSAPAGTACDDGARCTSMDRCNGSGVCAGTSVSCPDDGLSCTLQACEPATGTCGTTIATGCMIDGACIADGTRDPSNPCRACDSRQSRTTYSPIAAGTTCSAASCTDGVVTPAGACDGAGSCVVGPDVTCPSRACTGSMCRAPCTSDDDCARPTWCDETTGACTPDLPNGDPCGRAGMCLSELCIDGTCCGDTCMGTCRSCSVAGSEGECTYIPAGTDPDDECLGELTCADDGKCEMPDAGRVAPDAYFTRPDAYVPPGEDADFASLDASDIESSYDAGPFDPDALFRQFDGALPPPDAGDTGPLHIDADLEAPAPTSAACACRAVGTGTRPIGGLAALGLLALALARRRRAR